MLLSHIFPFVCLQHAGNVQEMLFLIPVPEKQFILIKSLCAWLQYSQPFLCGGQIHLKDKTELEISSETSVGKFWFTAHCSGLIVIEVK